MLGDGVEKGGREVVRRRRIQQCRATFFLGHFAPGCFIHGLFFPFASRRSLLAFSVVVSSLIKVDRFDMGVSGVSFA